MQNKQNIRQVIADEEMAIGLAKRQIVNMRDAASDEERVLSANERRTIAALEAGIEKANTHLPKLRAVQAEDDAADERAKQTTPTGVGSAVSRTASISVGREERTYHLGVDADRGLRNSPGGAFLLDVGAAFLGDRTAGDRLSRHMDEERRERPYLERANSGTPNFSGLVVPQYVVDDAAPAVSAARPLADNMTSRELPPTGMSVNLSLITTPTAASIQTTENTALTSQAIDDTLLTMPVETAGGWVQLSRQAIERGLLTEEITMADLLTRVAVSLETQVIAEATNGLVAKATSQTYTNATVDTTAVPTFLKQLPQAQNTLDTNLLSYSRPAVVVVAPRRFNWLTAASSSSWPMLSGVSPVQASGVILTNEYGPSVRAVMQNGMKIVVDANVTTTGLAGALTGGTQDQVYAFVAEQAYLYEPPERVVTIRAEQPSANQLGVLYVASEFFAYTFGRYPGQAVAISGTGLATPAFT